MKKRTALLLACAGFLARGAFAIDLTPHEVITAVEGPPVPRYFFQDDGKRLAFRIDNKMTINGSSEAATFGFRDIGTGNMKLSRSPFPGGFAFDEKTAETYLASARTFLPPQATDVQLEQENPAAITINGWTSHQYMFVYSVAGVSYRRSITFLNIAPQEQIVFDVCATVPDYAKTYARSYRVLNSLGVMADFEKAGPT